MDLPGGKNTEHTFGTDFTRPHPKWWFMWGISLQPPYFRLVKYCNSPRNPGHGQPRALFWARRPATRKHEDKTRSFGAGHGGCGAGVGGGHHGRRPGGWERWPEMGMGQNETTRGLQGGFPFSRGTFWAPLLTSQMRVKFTWGPFGGHQNASGISSPLWCYQNASLMSVRHFSGKSNL